MNAVLIQGSGYHDGQFAGDLADQGLRHIDIALHGLLYVLAVGIVLSVENADAVHADDVSPLEIVHGAALIDDGFLLLCRYFRIGQLGNAACVHGYVSVSRQFLFHISCRQNGSFAHHMIHSGKDAVIAGHNTGNTRSQQRCGDGYDET